MDLFNKLIRVLRDHPFKPSACLRGRGVKNLPNLQTGSTKKLPTIGGRGQKSVKNCRRLKWMVPKGNCGLLEIQNATSKKCATKSTDSPSPC